MLAAPEAMPMREDTLLRRDEPMVNEMKAFLGEAGAIPSACRPILMEAEEIPREDGAILMEPGESPVEDGRSRQLPGRSHRRERGFIDGRDGSHRAAGRSH
jgi:hypothetical protein